MSLVSLADIKTYLGISGGSYDQFLTDQEEIISQAIEAYCGRILSEDSYIETFYKEKHEPGVEELYLFHFPLVAITSVEVMEDGELIVDITDDVKYNLPTGNIRYKDGFFSQGNELVVTYDAGYYPIPAPIKSVVLSLVEERYNKKVNGIALSFGSDVQRVSIPGTISIDFDYTLQSNERKSGFGTILGSHINVVDYYRSERTLVGSIISASNIEGGPPNGGSQAIPPGFVELSDLDLDNGDFIDISTSLTNQQWTVQSVGGNVILSNTPLGTNAPPVGTEIELLGASDTDTVTLTYNDIPKGILLNGNWTSAFGSSLKVRYNSVLDRYTEVSRS